MHSMAKTLNVKGAQVLKAADKIHRFVAEKYELDPEYEYSDFLSGFIQFHGGASSYDFNNLDELNEVLAQEDLDEMYIWRLEVSVQRMQMVNKISITGAVVKLDFRLEVHERTYKTKLTIDQLPYKESAVLVNDVAKILSCTLYRPTRQEIARKRHQKEQESCISKCLEIFEVFPDLQLRNRSLLSNEKQVQDFLYPILKSHFADLQEEDYVPKVAGTASKPDFSINRLGVAIELKYVSARKTFSELTAEINDDSRKYFGATSPYEKMIVFIYNGASKSTPANFKADLERLPEIAGIVVSPNILPGK